MIHSHVVVDGSNLATEGRSQPSLRQLREAVDAFAAEHPSAKLTVVVDATFGHRIDSSEVAEFDGAVSRNELVAPPAGAIGRGDAFVLGIADKVSAVVLSNDSYQEFHGQYAWLFDEGRLVGGKPVPHIGWVFVNRVPVRGPLSRKSVSEAKRKGRRNTGPTTRDAGDGSVRVGSAEASKPMPVPKVPPPGATAAPKGKKATAAAKAAASAKSTAAAKSAAPAGRPQKGTGAKKATASTAPAAPAPASAPAKGAVNDLTTFFAFVERHPVGSAVSATVDHYSSHGAYVRIGDVWGYVPLRLMADPPPRSARSQMKVGESVALVVHEYVAATRSIDLAVPGVVTPSGRSSRRGPTASAASTDGLRKAAGSAGKAAARAVSAIPASKNAGAAKRAGSTTKGAAKKSVGPARKAAGPAKKSSASASAPTKAGSTKKAAKASPAKASPAKNSPAKKSPASKSPASKRTGAGSSGRAAR